MKSFEEFYDMIGDFIDSNVFPAGEEFDYSRKYKEHMKELYEEVYKDEKRDVKREEVK